MPFVSYILLYCHHLLLQNVKSLAIGKWVQIIDIQVLSVINAFFLWSYREKLSVSTLILKLKIIGQCDVGHIVILLIKTIMAVTLYKGLHIQYH